MNQPPDKLNPKTTALLVMDYQSGIVARIPEAAALLEKAARAIAAARRHGARVAYVRVAFDEADANAIPASNKAFSRFGPMIDAFRPDSPATQIDPRIAPQPEDILVRKTRVGAFSTTDLREQLTGAGITALILAGISTSGVVLSTVRDAADRDYRLFVVADACADPDPEVHRFLIDRIYPSQADVIDVGAIDGLF
ncbi:MAG TPA: cysteine hydrolase [Candidatus Acidoferrales bacterium]|nr:cysteine hydrolase [Candidatus Acidoferrales bacterium]